MDWPRGKERSTGKADATSSEVHFGSGSDVLFFRYVNPLSLRFLLRGSCFASCTNQRQLQVQAKQSILNLLALQLEHGTPLSQRILRVRQASH